MAQVSFLWTGKFMYIYRIISAYRLDYIFRSINVFFYVYLPDLIWTVYLFPFHIFLHWNNSIYRREFFILGWARQIYWIFSVYRRWEPAHNVYLPKSLRKLKTVSCAVEYCIHIILHCFGSIFDISRGSDPDPIV